MSSAAPPPRYALVIFDLDGTLADPGEAITGAIAQTLATFGIEEQDAARLRAFTGAALAEVFAAYGLHGEAGELAITRYRDVFPALAQRCYRPYPGIPELLQALRGRGAALAIATTKYAVQATALVAGLALDPFVTIQGATAADRDGDKTRLVQAALACAPSVPLDCVAVVGDRRYDLEAASRCGVDGIAAGWGFGTSEELLAAPHRFLAVDVRALWAFLLPD